jgi:hypothetical protein
MTPSAPSRSPSENLLQWSGSSFPEPMTLAAPIFANRPRNWVPQPSSRRASVSRHRQNGSTGHIGHGITRRHNGSSLLTDAFTRQRLIDRAQAQMQAQSDSYYFDSFSNHVAEREGMALHGWNEMLIRDPQHNLQTSDYRITNDLEESYHDPFEGAGTPSTQTHPLEYLDQTDILLAAGIQGPSPSPTPKPSRIQARLPVVNHIASTSSVPAPATKPVPITVPPISQLLSFTTDLMGPQRIPISSTPSAPLLNKIPVLNSLSSSSRPVAQHTEPIPIVPRPKANQESYEMITAAAPAYSTKTLPKKSKTRGYRSGPMTEEARIAAKKTRNEKSICIRCKVSKQTVRVKTCVIQLASPIPRSRQSFQLTIYPVPASTQWVTRWVLCEVLRLRSNYQVARPLYKGVFQRNCHIWQFELYM